MSNFKEYLAEGITIKDGKLVIDYKETDGQSTHFGKDRSKFIPFSSSKKSFEGSTIRSIYQLNMDTGVAVLKAMKRKTDVDMKESDYQQFINRTATYVCSSTSGIMSDIDVIVSPETSSKFNDDMLKAIKERRPDIKIIRETFVKSKVDEIKIDFSKFPNVSDKTKKSVESILSKAKKNGYLEVKNVPKMFLNYFSNVLKLDSQKIKQSDVEDKNVLIFDDLLGSGFTITEMINSIKTFSPKNVSGLTIFKTKG